MSKNNISQSSRRGFLGIIPACAISCLACSSAFAQSKGSLFGMTGALQDKVHPFDEEMARKITYRQFMTARSLLLLDLGKWMMKQMGHDQALEFLKEFTAQRTLADGKEMGDKSKNRSFREYTDLFRNTERWRNNLTMEIVEDSEKDFELKVTECLVASVTLAENAGELGTALVCHGDYTHAEGFNPNIKLVRDKTLMQGDSYCNHRYIWTA